MFLLAGCWDERLYNEHTVVSLVGLEGTFGEMKGYFAYPEAKEGSAEITIVESEGIEPRELRLNAELKVEHTIDLSMMSTLLISEDLAKDGLTKYLDVYYRDPSNSITSFIVLVKGDVKDYLEASKSWSTEAGEYYARFIKGNERISIVPHRTLQTAGSILYSNGIDLVLPYMILKEESQRPELDGVGLFSKGKFTGRILKPEQSKFLGLLLQERGRRIELSTLYNDKPLAVTILDASKKWDVTSSNSVKLDYELQIQVQEFSEAGLRNTKKISELEKIIEKKVTDEVKEVIQILQEEKSDAMGLGNLFRVKKPEAFDENWHENFAKLDIQVEVKADILKVGIIH